MIPTCLLMLMP